jgi:hypothetical protein
MKKWLFYLGTILTSISFTSSADWVSSKVDRIQALPNGNVYFWLTSKTGECGSHQTPYKVELGQYGLTDVGINTIKSIVLASIATDKSLVISVRDELCRVDSLTLVK